MSEREHENVDQSTERAEAELIYQLQISKDSIGKAAGTVIDAVRNGNINPLEARIRLQVLEKFIEMVKEQIKDESLTEAYKHPSGKFEYMGCELQIKEAGVRYNFDECGDPMYLDLKDKLKKRETFLKAVDKELNIVTDDGEVITIKQPIKSSTTTVTISIK